jgi:phosphoribosylaminoimidazole-succinocarboxamide synthase
MEKATLLYEGKAKQVYATQDPERVILHYKDDATAFNGIKKAQIADKGVINCRLSAFFLEMVRPTVPVHFEKQLSPRDQLCRKVEIIPVEVVVRNRIAGSFAKKLGLAEGGLLSRPVVELFYKSDALNDPPVNEDAALALGWAKGWELLCMREYALEVNRILIGFWDRLGVDVVDFKLEFGRIGQQVVLADEITPDGARLWERGTGRHLDKDVFRRDLGDLSETYREIYQRVFGERLL